MVRDSDTGAQLTFTLVAPEDAEAGVGRVSPHPPVARALLGHHVGDLVTVATPRGQRRVAVIAVAC